MTMRVVVNGELREMPDGATVADLVAVVTGLVGGVAAAVNGEVVPRRGWAGALLHAGDQVEVVTAVQGGGDDRFHDAERKPSRRGPPGARGRPGGTPGRWAAGN